MAQDLPQSYTSQVGSARVGTMALGTDAPLAPPFPPPVISYPVDIPLIWSGYSLGSNNPRGRHTFEYAGNFYWFLAQDNVDDPVGDLKVHALKSTDRGLSYADMDPYNAPDVAPDTTTGAPPEVPSPTVGTCYTVARDGATVYVIIGSFNFVRSGSTASVNGFYVVTFDLAAERWGAISSLYTTPVVDFESGGSGGPHTTLLYLIVVAPGQYQFFYSGLQESGMGRLYTASFNGATFSTAVELPDQSGTGSAYFGVGGIAENGRTHFWYTSSEGGLIGAPLYHIGLDTDGVTFGVTTKVTDDLYLTGGNTTVPTISEAILAQVSGSANQLALVAEINDNVASSTQSIRIFYADLALNPTWSNAIVHQGVDGDSWMPDLLRVFSFWTPVVLTLGYANSNLIVSYCSFDLAFTPVFAYSTSRTGTFSWTAPAALIYRDTIGNDPRLVQVTALLSSAGVGITGFSFDNDTDSYYLAQFYFFPIGGVTFGNFWDGMIGNYPGNCFG